MGSLPEECSCTGARNGRMTSAMVEEWLRLIWECHACALLFKDSLLIFHSYRGHLTDAVKTALSKGRMDLGIIPGGMSSQLQLLDVAIKKPFKEGHRKFCTDWLTKRDHQLTPAKWIKHASLGQVMSCITAAWEDVPAELIIR